ncbi:MAG: GvpL/GvpF family gas vesicle protein [Thermoanaerobaculia bacterium]
MGQELAMKEQSSTPDHTRNEPDQGKYVYCIIKTDQPLSFGNLGIGGRGDDVFTVHHKGFAAVVSNCPLVVFDPTRDNALAHEHVNEVVMKDFTVLPMSFGTVFRTEDDIRAFLAGTYDALVEVLEKMEGKIEFGLKVNWNRDLVIREIENENDEIQRLKADQNASQSYFARMQLGRLVETALQEKSDRYVTEIYETLRGAAIASRSNKPIGEKMILNAAFLVDRDKTRLFDEQVSEIARKYENRLTFLYTGPWPPYNFVNIRLRLERTDR